ncbi:hypothetical protein B0H19DRAFT_1082352 [Mycena capillaripes]|nr:hypothetical protein B0H19DRAFT_1082352 [Mycena capillaripes]
MHLKLAPSLSVPKEHSLASYEWNMSSGAPFGEVLMARRIFCRDWYLKRNYVWILVKINLASPRRVKRPLARSCTPCAGTCAAEMQQERAGFVLLREECKVVVVVVIETSVDGRRQLVMFCGHRSYICLRVGSLVNRGGARAASGAEMGWKMSPAHQ